ncbi:hypothetical protein PR048_016277 [Dryococelus australis]|uniref:Uncharacterized protein n=1 Tax=Dryococelus australis TaxID=614101 RepID=A0ABQ9HJG4_9NEOP|nr:hypothetical protein PR048_016277 [Dryococelus australis]
MWIAQECRGPPTNRERNKESRVVSDAGWLMFRTLMKSAMCEWVFPVRVVLSHRTGIYSKPDFISTVRELASAAESGKEADSLMPEIAKSLDRTALQWRRRGTQDRIKSLRQPEFKGGGIGIVRHDSHMRKSGSSLITPPPRLPEKSFRRIMFRLSSRVAARTGCEGARLPRRTRYDSRRRHSQLSQVKNVPEDAAGRRDFSEISGFPRLCIPTLLHNHPTSPSFAELWNVRPIVLIYENISDEVFRTPHTLETQFRSSQEYIKTTFSKRHISKYTGQVHTQILQGPAASEKSEVTISGLYQALALLSLLGTSRSSEATYMSSVTPRSSYSPLEPLPLLVDLCGGGLQMAARACRGREANIRDRGSLSAGQPYTWRQLLTTCCEQATPTAYWQLPAGLPSRHLSALIWSIGARVHVFAPPATQSEKRGEYSHSLVDAFTSFAPRTSTEEFCDLWGNPTSRTMCWWWVIKMTRWRPPFATHCETIVECLHDLLGDVCRNSHNFATSSERAGHPRSPRRDISFPGNISPITSIDLPAVCTVATSLLKPGISHIHFFQRCDGNTARVARRSDEALGVRVSPSLLDLGRAGTCSPEGAHSILRFIVRSHTLSGDQHLAQVRGCPRVPLRNVADLNVVHLWPCVTVQGTAIQLAARHTRHTGPQTNFTTAVGLTRCSAPCMRHGPSPLLEVSTGLAKTQECSGETGWRLGPPRRITRVGEDSRPPIYHH